MKISLVRTDEICFINYKQSTNTLMLYFKNGQVGEIACSSSVADKFICGVEEFMKRNSISNLYLGID